MSRSTTATPWIVRLSLTGVSSIAAIASYSHALAVVQAADGPGLVSHLVPALADLTIFAGSANVLDAARRGEARPRWSVAAIVVSVAVTLGSNVAAGSPHEVPLWLVNAWPAVAFLLTLEALMGHVRRSAGTPEEAAEPAAMDTPAPCPHAVPATREEAVLTAYAHGRDCEGEAPTFRELERRFGVRREKVAALVRQPEPVLDVVASANGHAFWSES